MVQIAVLDDYQNVAFAMADWSVLQVNHRVHVFNAPFKDTAAAAAALVGFDVVCLMRERTPFPRALIERLPMLRLIVTTGMHNAAVDTKAAADQGVMVCGTPGLGPPTAELTMGLMLAMARNIPFEVGQMVGGHWQTTVGITLHGRTIGIIGLGRLGGTVARMAQAFGMKVMAWSENLTDVRAAECGAERVASKDELLGRADVVTIHTRLSERTRGLIGDRELHLMKPSAFLINTSRGPIVHEGALMAALEAGRIAGAALDVYDVEPLPTDHPLRRTPRLLLTPHIGYVTVEGYRVFYEGTVAAVEAWLKGTPVNVIAAPAPRRHQQA